MSTTEADSGALIRTVFIGACFLFCVNDLGTLHPPFRPVCVHSRSWSVSRLKGTWFAVIARCTAITQRVQPIVYVMLEECGSRLMN